MTPQEEMQAALDLKNELARLIVSTVTSEILKLEKKLESKLKTFKFSGEQIKQNTLPGNSVKDGSLPSGKFFQLDAYIGNFLSIQAETIIATLIQTGELDAEIIGIFNSDTLRILANGEGIYAFFKPEAGDVDLSTYVRFYDGGLECVKNDVQLVKIGWEGLKLFEIVDGVAQESLVADSTGKLSLRRGLLVGNDPTDGIYINGLDKSIGTSRYTSGQLGSGWKIEGDGSATFNNLKARGVFTSAVHQFNKISSAGGSFLVTPTLILGSDSTISTVNIGVNTHYSISVEFPFTGSIHRANGMNWSVNDLLSLQGIAEVSGEPYEIVDLRFKIKEFTETGCIIESISHIEECTFYRQSDGEAYDEGLINLNGGTLLKSTSIMFIGRVAEDGSILHKGIYLSVTDEYGPYIDVYDAETPTSMPVVRIGNLQGIENGSLREAPSGYGAYLENAYVIGQIVSNRGKIGGMNIDEHSISTADGMNGIGDGDADSPVIWAGDTDPNSALFRVKKDGTLYIGTEGGDHFSYDGENLDINAKSITITSGESTIILGDAIEGLVSDTTDLKSSSDEIKSYVYYNADGVNVTAPGFVSKTIVSSDGLHIKDNTGVETAYFKDGSSYIKSAEITKQLTIAGLVGEARSDGRITWRKV